MKNMLIVLAMIMSIGFLKTGFADATKLRMNITGDVTSSYLCINNLGCYKIGPQTNGKELPIDVDDVQYLAMANVSTKRLYKQALPASCNGAISENKTLVISGHVTKSTDNTMVINGLRCSVV